MSVQDYSPFFQPEELDALSAAYDAAWQQFSVNSPTLTADELSVLKKNLAQVILAAARDGNLDAEHLKQIALRSVSGRSRGQLPANSANAMASSPDGRLGNEANAVSRHDLFIIVNTSA